MSHNPYLHGALSWCELMTTDAEAAKRFYTELLGWTCEPMDMGEFVYHVMKTGDQMVGGIMTCPKEMQGMPPAWGTYITVDNVDARAAAVEKLGGKLLVPPTDIPEVGRFCALQDPQGATLYLITYLPR